MKITRVVGAWSAKYSLQGRTDLAMNHWAIADYAAFWGVEGRYTGEGDGYSAALFLAMFSCGDIARKILEQLAPATITLFCLCICKALKVQLTHCMNWEMRLANKGVHRLVPFHPIFERRFRAEPRMITFKRYIGDGRRLLERHYSKHYADDQSSMFYAGTGDEELDRKLIPGCSCTPGKPCSERVLLIAQLATKDVKFVAKQNMSPATASRRMIAQIKDLYEGPRGDDGRRSVHRLAGMIDIASEWATSRKKAPVKSTPDTRTGDGGYDIDGEQYHYCYDPNKERNSHEFVIAKGMRILMCGWKVHSSGSSNEKHMFVQPIWRMVTVKRFRGSTAEDVLMTDLTVETKAWEAHRTTAEMSRICWTLNGTRYVRRNRNHLRKRGMIHV